MKLNGSWKTTALGAGGLMVVIGNIMNMLFDNDPNTNPDWSIYLPIIAGLVANMFSKDINVTNSPLPVNSHQVEIKKMS